MSNPFGYFGLAAALCLAALTAAAKPVEVDLELVLATDTSGSMSFGLRQLQREGFVAAFRDRKLQYALLSGPLGRVAVSYVEWSGLKKQRLTVPWRLLDSPASIEGFANELESQPVAQPVGGTSISAALVFSAALLEASPYESFRQVIDISGNGSNNDGMPVENALAAIATRHIVVNAIAFPDAPPGSEDPYSVMFKTEAPDLLDYFNRTVRNGPGSFAVGVERAEDLGPAILRKLVLEVAGLDPDMLD